MPRRDRDRICRVTERHMGETVRKLIIGALLVVLATSGCDALRTAEDTFLRSIEIAGHEAATFYYDEALFIGPPTKDLLGAVQAPEMDKSPGPASLSYNEWEFVGTGAGRTRDGTECGVEFQRL